MKKYPLASFVFFASAAALSTAAFGGTFTGPGLFTDQTKWSDGTLPKISEGKDEYIKGLCGATNEAARLEGGNWCHLGCGDKAGALEVKDCDFYFNEFRIACSGRAGIYSQQGGSLYLQSTTSIGYEKNYPKAGIELDGVAVTNKTIKIGSQPAKNGVSGAAYLRARGCTFKSSESIKALNGGIGEFVGCRLSGGHLRPSSASISLVDGSVFTATGSGALYPGADAAGVGTLAITNSVVDMGEKTYLGGVRGSCGEIDLSGSFWTNKYQVYVGYADGSTGLVRSANSVLTFNHQGYVGNGKNSFGEMVLGGGTKFKVANYFYVGSGSNAVGRLVYDGMDWADNSVSQYRFASGVDSVGSVVYRNVAGRRQYPLANVFSEANTNGYAETVFDNSHYSAGASAYFGQAKRKARVSVVNGGTFDVVRDGDIWMPDDAGSDVRFFVTNSPLFRIQASGKLKHEKSGAKLHFDFHDATAYICTNSTFLMAQSAGSEASISLSGDSSVTMDTISCYSAGESRFDLNGGVLTLGRISSGAPEIRFNGGALRSKYASAAWVPAGARCYVQEGPAVFDVRHAMTFPASLLCGSQLEKDGGIVKKGTGTLKLTAGSHGFTGDIEVEEGVLDVSSLSGWALAAGQKIGGAGTLKVAQGFTAGGISYTAGQGAPLTVDGTVTFAPGSSVTLKGVGDGTAARRFVLLKASAVCGGENLSADALPNGWAIRADGTAVKAVSLSGLRLIVR